jgi:hypothetical protein
MGNESSTGTSVIVGDIDKKNAVIIQSEQPPNYDDLVRQGADPLQGDGEIFTTSLSHLRERLGTL